MEIIILGTGMCTTVSIIQARLSRNTVDIARHYYQIQDKAVQA